MTPFEQILWSDPIKTFVNDDTFAKQLYAALCNVLWKHSENEEYGCTWRGAGGIVAELRNKGEDYMDFYCSGNEGIVHENISKLLLCHGCLINIHNFERTKLKFEVLFRVVLFRVALFPGY